MVFAHLVIQVEVSPSKGALLHLPAPFLPAFLHPLPGLSVAAQGARKLAGYGAGEGGRGEDGGGGGGMSGGL